MFGSTQPKPAGGLFGTTTSAPQAGGVFGSTATTQSQSGGLFGSTAASSQPGGLFGSTATTTQPQAGGLFGSAQPAQSGGLFGSTAASTQPQTGGLFGSAQPAQSGGLFGNTSSSQPGQTGGLFGSSQPQQSGGLFGNTNTSQPTQTGGLFGASNTASQPQQTGGMFSGLAGQQNQPTGGLFGAANPTQPAQGGLFNNMNNQNQNKPSLFGSSAQGAGQLNQNTGQGLFGSTLGGGLSLGQSNQQQQTVPGVRVDPSQIRGTTRFNDLHEELQKEITKFDDIIQAQIQLKNQCDAIMTAHDSQLAQVPTDVEFCRRKLIGVENAADSDVQAISLAQKLVKTDAEHAKLSFKAIDNLKLPPQYHNSNIWSSKAVSGSQTQSNGDAEAQDIVSFFSSTADEIASTLSSYQKHMIEIEQHLRNVEASSVSQQSEFLARKNGAGIGQDDPIEQLTGALTEFESSLLGVAGRVGGAREGLQSLQLGKFTGPPTTTRSGYRNGVY
ncbi:uncharacterized protein LY89DRAFT_669792 [Mollisia scopiformis]|uniref:Uncharacterized protein n=1 Tax=Mollisia scopiformis TaxID=149040 RepID=A0A194X815_MOLSC|nr:uncharacterized protein LY89DRAFT_669792 [Mollisia scopiformis]KUJ16259.1 hypothetical protein LY89DRAFT_669792 [Mollisia scopiformis]